MKRKYLSLLSVLFLIGGNSGFTYEMTNNNNEYVGECDYTNVLKRNDAIRKKDLTKIKNIVKKYHGSKSTTKNNNTLKRANHISDYDCNVKPINSLEPIEHKYDEYNDEDIRDIKNDLDSIDEFINNNNDDWEMIDKNSIDKYTKNNMRTSDDNIEDLNYDQKYQDDFLLDSKDSSIN